MALSGRATPKTLIHTTMPDPHNKTLIHGCCASACTASPAVTTHRRRRPPRQQQRERPCMCRDQPACKQLSLRFPYSRVVLLFSSFFEPAATVYTPSSKQTWLRGALFRTGRSAGARVLSSVKVAKAVAGNLDASAHGRVASEYGPRLRAKERRGARTWGGGGVLRSHLLPSGEAASAAPVHQRAGHVRAVQSKA